MGDQAEAKLLARCRRGEADAWDEIFDLHYAPMGRFVFQLGAQLTREDVEEICQEALLSAIRHVASFKGGCQFQTWLFRIAANKARDFVEKRNAAKRGGGAAPISLQAEDAETGLTLDPPSGQPGPDASLLRGEDAVLVGRALAELGGPCREIIELRYFADLGYKEISRALNLNEKTVSSRLSKCLDKLEVIVRALFAEGKSRVSPSNP